MVRGWEDRLQLRRLEQIGLVAALAAGAALTPGAITSDAGKMLVTFLGLVSASILPTISLLVNSMTASGRSVFALNKLQAELQAAIDALFLLFGCVGIAVWALMSMAFAPPPILEKIPYLTTEVLPRMGQMFVVAPVALVLLRAGQIPGILRRSLAVRHEIAVDEAKKKLADKAPTGDAVRQTFANHPDFGKSVKLEDLPRETH